MKRLLTLILILSGTAAHAQPKLITQAIITTKTTIVSPEGDEAAAPPTVGPNGEEVRIVRFGGEGETNTTTWLKNDLVKTYSESDMGRTTAIRDNGKKMTTTIMEMMGKKMGFFVSDDEQEQMRKQMDSMMRSRKDAEQRPPMAAPGKTEITYIDESKKIAGYACKKALVITSRNNRKDTTVTWYIPGLKLQWLTSTGGSMGGFGGMSPQLSFSGMEDLNGFPMQYERTLNMGRKMTVLVTKLVTDKEVDEKEFDIPKDVKLKPLKEMQNGGAPGSFQMRIGG